MGGRERVISSGGREFHSLGIEIKVTDGVVSREGVSEFKGRRRSG